MDPAVIGTLIPIIAVLSVFTFLTIIIVAKHRYRALERQKLYETAKVAIENGQTLPPEVIAALAELPAAKRTAFSDLRAGVIWLAAGVGTMVFGFVLGLEEPEAMHPLMGIGAIPALIGVALIVLSRFNPNRDITS